MPELIINRERLQRTFIDLASISSPSFAEDAVFTYIAENLHALGLACHFQEYDRGRNLVAVLEASDAALPAIALVAHADTVGPCGEITVHCDGITVKSDGTTVLGGDDKTAIAEIIETICVITEQDLPHGRIEIIVTSAEEVGLVGAKHLDISGLHAKHCLVLDASGEIGTAVIGAPHQVSFTITCGGKKAHAGIEPEKGVNAIVVAAAIVQGFPVGRLDEHSVANYGSIAGGGASNIVPDRISLHGELRSHDKSLLESHLDRLKRTIDAVSASFGIVSTLEVVEEYSAYRIAENDPLLGLVHAAVSASGLPFKAIVAGGGSDANILSARGLSCVNLACGMRQVHTNEEYVVIDDLVSTSAVLVEALTRQLGRLAAAG